MGKLTNLNPSSPIADADLPASIARDSEFAAADAAHVAAADPHPQYLLQAEGDARYRQRSIALTDADIPAEIARDTEVAAADAAHVAAADPHPQYLLQAEGDARYRQSSQSQVFNPTTKNIAISTGGIATIDNSYANQCGLEIQSVDNSSAAYVAFHRPGIYAIHFGLDTNNQLSVGGWSLGNATYRILHEGAATTSRAALPVAGVAGNSITMGWNSVQSGQGIAELCNYAGLGGGDAFNFFRMPGAANEAPSISHRVSKIDITGAYIQTSDRRLKQNFSASPGLAEILALLPQRYQHYECLGFEGKKIKLGKNFLNKIGFVAQDLQQSLPEAVVKTKSEEELYSIDYSCIVACLVQAVQEQQQQINELRAQMKTLPEKTKMANARQQINELRAQMKTLK